MSDGMKQWIGEFQSENLELRFSISSIVHEEQSKFQKILVADTIQYGRMLLLDNAVMTTLKDEFVYHEMITHVPLFAHPEPKRVAVIGGGDGGAICEILKHDSVEEAVLVEIDERVVKVSQQYLPEISHALSDKRVTIVIDDGIKYLKNSKNEFDVIIIDSTDPVGPAEGLFSKEFYTSVFNALAVDGIFVAQTESPFLNREFIRTVYARVSSIFPNTGLYLASIPTYPSGLWSFTIGSKTYSIKSPYHKGAADTIPTRYYTSTLHEASFVLPGFVEELIINK
jgi:spermidine synthase